MSGYIRKYQKVTGWWVYGHITPNGKIYIGYSGGKDGDKQCCDRWKKDYYETTSLQPYIEKYGWDNIKHIVFKDGLTKKLAEQLEDLLIVQATIDDWCINKQGSGGEARDNPKNYQIEAQRKFNKKRLSTPEGKIYNRVHRYNEYHPDRKIETPLEAKNKYLEYGYIPSYIKNNDLV